MPDTRRAQPHDRRPERSAGPTAVGWVAALRENRKIEAVRVFALGVRPAYQHTIEALEDPVILEVSTPEPHDVVRMGDRYGRAVEASAAERR